MLKSSKSKGSNKRRNCGEQSSISKYFSASSQKPTRKRITVMPSEGIVSPKTSKTAMTRDSEKEFKSASADIKAQTSNTSNSEINNKNSETLPCSESFLLAFNYCKKENRKDSERKGVFSESAIAESIGSSQENVCSTSANLEKIPSNSSDEEMNTEETKVQKVIKYTPLEKQYLEFQQKYPDAVLMIECGYKYRFFGKDAEIAKKDLNIGCFPYHNFLSASVPVHRLHYHARRLVLRGHKVAVIKQTESAALKAIGDTRNEVFNRALYAMYTKATFINEELSTLDDEKCIEVECSEEDNAGSGFLMCISEISNSKKQSASFSSSTSNAFVAVEINSGDVLYSTFQNSIVQNDLENFLACLNPSEILVPKNLLSKNTEKMLKTFCCDRSVRIEYIDEKVFESSCALHAMSTFVSNENSTNTAENLQLLLSLPSLVISCLSALRHYLADFKLESILKDVKNMREFSTDDNMVLSAATLRGLDVLQSSCYPKHSNTLFGTLNWTFTKFGQRMMKSWIVKPLKNIEKIEERLNIVTEIIRSDSTIFNKLSRLLYKMPDLERLLCFAFYHKASCQDFLKLVDALERIQSELLGLSDKIETDIKEFKLKSILLNTIKYLNKVGRFSRNIDPEAAKKEDKKNLFLDTSEYKNIEGCKAKISVIEKKLNDLRPSICKTLKLLGFNFATVAGQKFLIEVPHTHQSLVPDEWLKISVTKQVSRYQSPEVLNLCRELNQEQERLLVSANEAWNQLLDEFGEHFHKYKTAVFNLAELDCYLSFAKVSKDESYCRPLATNSGNGEFYIKQGRHPVISKLMVEEKQFVANDAKLNNTERCLIVTGPNMGGKSTYIRQIALIAIMTHMGCYVPAESVTIPLLDNIYVRMGAEDDIVSRKSTFMTEMSEASHILQSATSKSLVIFDELGRGTSTNDGAAIAYATLKYLIGKVKCLTLFVTHYPPVVELKRKYPENIITVHMGFLLNEMEDEDDFQTVVFLYNVVEGISEKSYGINVAALAGIQKHLLIEAQKKSFEMEKKSNIYRKLVNLLDKLKKQNLEETTAS